MEFQTLFFFTCMNLIEVDVDPIQDWLEANAQLIIDNNCSYFHMERNKTDFDPYFNLFV